METVTAKKCLKRTVWCIIESLNDHAAVKGHNICNPPGDKCNRTDADTGKNYEKCNSYHAEEVTAQMWLEACEGSPKPAMAYIHGHDYICDNCKKALRAVGVQEMIVVKSKDVFNAIWEKPEQGEIH